MTIPCQRSGALAEIQGLYGAFGFPERLLQQIWLRREFDVLAARTVAGARVAVIHPGRWNHLGGPDFKGARLRIGDGPEVTGDIELHLRAADWDAHGHARDAAYADVVLHVVLFWPDAGHETLGVDGKPVPVLPLLPILYRDLEEYASDDAVEVLTERPTARLMGELARAPVPDVRRVLLQEARVRWAEKVRYAALRISRLGWESACHHAALEILGFRFNRPPMLRVASLWPLQRWRENPATAADAWRQETGHWSVQGVRPANHPLTRLRQYGGWVSARPDWPEQLREALAGSVWRQAAGTHEFRREFELKRWHSRLGALTGGMISGPRLNTLVCDGFLPLAAAAGVTSELFHVWWHWFGGDIPPFVSTGLRHLGLTDGRIQPSCHGLAQGLLRYLIEREVGRGLP